MKIQTYPDWDYSNKVNKDVDASDRDDLVKMVKSNTSAIDRMMKFMEQNMNLNIKLDSPSLNLTTDRVLTVENKLHDSDGIIPISELNVDPRYHPVKPKMHNPTAKYLRSSSERNSQKYLDSIRYWLRKFHEAQEPISIWWTMYEEPLENTVFLKSVDTGRAVVAKVLAKEIAIKGYVPERTWFLDQIFGISVPKNTARLNAKRTMERFFNIPFNPRMNIDLNASKSTSEENIKPAVSSFLPKEEAGRDYELYLAHELMNSGYHVIYNGMIEGKNDGGVDLIAEKDGVRRLIQAKHWKSSMQITEQDVLRMKRDFDSFVEKNSDKFFTPWDANKDTYELFVSDQGIVSSNAIDACLANGIKISKEIRPYKTDWPRIKGIVSMSSNAKGKKLAYGPDNVSYTSESCQMAGRRGHRWFSSFEEAEKSGYFKGGTKR